MFKNQKYRYFIRKEIGDNCLTNLQLFFEEKFEIFI